jgi:cytochrome b
MNALSTTVRVWDLPTRIFHWTLAACVIGAVVSAKAGVMDWHFRLGYAVCALLAFRILWGLVGGRWSRFASFIYAPGTVLRYLRGQARPDEHLDVGHNPLGAFSVFAVLAVLAVQVGTGLIGDDEIANVGPLNRLVSTETGILATGFHKSWGQWTILALVGLHIAAIAFYAFRGKALVGAMVSGDKDLPADTPAATDNTRTRVLAAVLLAVCAAGVVWMVRSAY